MSNTNIKEKEMMSLFPSILFKCELEDITICDDIERKLKSLKNSGEGTFENKNFVTSDMLQDDPAFADLSKIILEQSEEILNFYTVMRDSHYISNMWGNITNANHRQMIHVHPNSYLSGILYIRTPEKCGFTSFSDPRPGARIFEPSVVKLNEYNAGVFMYPPKKGTMLLWNSWLPHGVEAGFVKSNEDRIVVAFNVMLKGKIFTKTAQLTL